MADKKYISNICKVPQIIQDIRKLPFGNFVSFPAEMIRTTYNILSIGAKEATSSNAQLRQTVTEDY